MALVGAPLLLQAIKKSSLFSKKANSFRDNVEYNAYRLSEKIGTLYPRWDPRNWSEDDTGAVQIILDNQGQYSAIAAEYYKITSRRLSEDVIKYIDDYSKISHVI